MWRYYLCAVLLLPAPAVAQTTPFFTGAAQSAKYDPPHRRERRSEDDAFGLHHRGRHFHHDSLQLGIEPSLIGPAPTGFWYRCDAPQGYYPYIPVCSTPWRLVPAGPRR